MPYNFGTLGTATRRLLRHAFLSHVREGGTYDEALKDRSDAKSSRDNAELCDVRT